MGKMPTLRRDGALSAIITYKLARAAGSLLTALSVLALSLTGITGQAERFLQAVHHDALNELSRTLSELALSALAPQHLLLVLGVLLVDATVLFLEGWGLQRGWRSAPWLVVVASGLLVPFELAAVLEQLTVMRVAVLGINLAIISYLLVRTWRAEREIPVSISAETIRAHV